MPVGQELPQFRTLAGPWGKSQSVNRQRVTIIPPLWQHGSWLEAKGEAVAEGRGMAGGTDQQISSNVKRVSVGSSQSSHEQHPPSLSEFGINERRTRHVGTKTSALQKPGM